MKHTYELPGASTAEKEGYLRENSVKVRNLQRMRKFFENSVRKHDNAKEYLKKIQLKEEEDRYTEENEDVVSKTMRNFITDNEYKRGLTFDADEIEY